MSSCSNHTYFAFQYKLNRPIRYVLYVLGSGIVGVNNVQLYLPIKYTKFLFRV